MTTLVRRALLSLLSLSFTAAAFAIPTITSVTPSNGFTYANTTVTINGDFGPMPGGVYDCRGANAATCPVIVFFGTQQAEVIEVSANVVRALAPPHAAGIVDVTVHDPRNGDATRVQAFRYAADAVTTPADYVQYLVPLTTSRVPGAYGSLWTSEVTATNLAEVLVKAVWNYCPPNVSPCPAGFFLAASTAKLYVGNAGDGREGAFIWVPKYYAPAVALAERVRDESKNAASFGTEIPVVRVGGDFTSNDRPVAHLLDIPTDPKYRAMLRIYSANDYPMMAVVRTYAQATNELLSSEEVMLSGITYIAEPDAFAAQPAYAQRDPLTDAARASGDRIRITVEARAWDVLISPRPVLPVYAFVSITNNETQQVTTVTPSR